MSARHRLQAWSELFKRYGKVFKYSWQRRNELTLPTLKAHEAEFLPAALSLQAKPVSPTGRWVARILIALIAVALIWSVLGHIDIVVTGQGKIIAGGYTKTIASVEVASVRALHVEEGQAVKIGDVLIELDTRVTDSERDKAEGDRQTAALQAARSRALLSAIDSGKPPKLNSIDGIAKDRGQDAVSHLQDQWRDYIAKRARLDGEIQHYSQSLQLAERQANDYAELAKTRDVSKDAYLEKERARIELQGQLINARNQKVALTAETRKAAQDALNEANRIVASATQDVQRASAHGALLKLTSPVDGTVQQLNVHTVGGVVPAAQPLMQIVPRQTAVEMEAFLENKDVGFVQEGQHAEVKIDAFEYTKYGTITATVSHVSRDAIQDEKKGLIYSVKVNLDRSTIFVDGREALLTPGMSSSVEIKTGTRRVIEYVLSPLVQHGRESLHER
ncbi:MAG: HlyD family type I secretion periplasmic adaptor subunit [Pseudomonadota bacterium]